MAVRYLDDDGNPLGDRGGSQARIPAASYGTPAPAAADSTVDTPSPSLGSNIASGDNLGARNDPGKGAADASAASAQFNLPAQDVATVNGLITKYGLNPSEVPYWMNFVAQHGGVDQVGLSWLDDAIHRADSSADVLSGKISKRPSETGAAPIAGSAVVPANGNAQGYVPTPTGISGGDPAFMASLRSIIQSRLAADQQPVDVNDLQISAPLQAARDEASRSTDQERTAEAEREYAQGGLNTNALNQTIQQSAERNATSLGSLRGTLVQQAYAQKQQDLQNILSQAISAGDTESAQRIQSAITNLQAQLQREGYGVSLAENAANQNYNTVASVL